MWMHVNDVGGDVLTESRVRVTSRHLDLGHDEIELIASKLGSLEHHCRGPISCHVVVDIPHKRHKQGRKYRVHVTVKDLFEADIEGRNLIVASEHEDLFVAVAKAVRTLKRELRRYNRRGSGRRLQVESQKWDQSMTIQ